MTTSRVQLEVFNGSQGLMFAIPAKILDLSLVYHVLCLGGFSVKLDVSHSSLFMYINVLCRKNYQNILGLLTVNGQDNSLATVQTFCVEFIHTVHCLLECDHDS